MNRELINAHTAGPWTTTEYGYERHSIQDSRGTEIGFAHRHNDARLAALEGLVRRADFGVEDSAEYGIAQDALLKARGYQ